MKFWSCECASHRVFGMASQLTGEMSWMENFSCSGCMYRSSEKTTIQIIKTPLNQTHSLYQCAHASKPCPTSFDGLILLLLSGHSGDACALLFNTGAHRIHLKHKWLINIWLPRLLIAAQIQNTEELFFSHPLLLRLHAHVGCQIEDCLYTYLLSTYICIVIFVWS